MFIQKSKQNNIDKKIIDKKIIEHKSTVHVVSLMGMRPDNQDKHSVVININGEDPTLNNINLYAVFDGHGGKFVSKYLYDNLIKFFTNVKVKYPLNKKYITTVYNYFRDKLKTKYFNKANHVGSTCLVVVEYMQENTRYLNICNTGDSRCVIARDNIGIPLTKDHKPDWPEERARIEQMGGTIVWDNYDYRIGDLSVSRAFGDIDAEPYVINIPDIFKYKITKNDSFIIVACDGLWDVMTNQEVVNFILDKCYDKKTKKRENKQINISKLLANEAIKKESSDNITVIVVFFD
jgi:serine/threonine protein phosphatase PrpC